MKRQHLREMIAGGESLAVEFKRKFSSEEKIAKEIIAFANSKGGYLLVGVDDDKTIVGVRSEKEEIDLIETVLGCWIEPPPKATIEIVNIEYRDVVVVFVPESANKPHRLAFAANGAPLKRHEQIVYIRQGSEALQASKEVVKVLEASNGNAKPMTLSIGKHERRFFEYLELHGRATAKELAADANISERRAIRLLVRLIHVGALRIHTGEKTNYFTLPE